jgi:5-methylcytosine-specific restriction endonuclease McrA
MCLAQSEVVPATIVDHVVPHKGNPESFWLGQIQSLCIDHHNGTKQQSEKRGYHTDIGFDGWPLDVNHPVNKLSLKEK